MIVEDGKFGLRVPLCRFQGVSIALGIYIAPEINDPRPLFRPSLLILSPSVLPLQLIPSLPIPTHPQPSHFDSTHTKIEMIQRLAVYRD